MLFTINHVKCTYVGYLVENDFLSKKKTFITLSSYDYRLGGAMIKSNTIWNSLLLIPSYQQIQPD